MKTLVEKTFFNRVMDNEMSILDAALLFNGILTLIGIVGFVLSIFGVQILGL